MINVVLVDDDTLALTRLKQLIALQDVRIAGEFILPEQALDYILNEPVDIVVTDMRMPKLDGIRLIRRVKEAKPDVQAIAVSSYEDFHYVKESFKEGSIDYILKHAMDEESVARALSDAIARIRSSRSDSAAESPLAGEILEESRHALKATLITEMLKEERPVEAIQAEMDKFGISFPIGSSIVVACEIDDYRKITAHFGDKDKRIFHHAVMDLLERVLAKVPDKEIVRMEEGQFVLLLAYPHIRSQLYIYNETHDLCRRLHYNLEKLLNVKLSVAIGDCCSGWGDLVRSYLRCVQLLSRKFYAGKGNVYLAAERQDADEPARTPSALSEPDIDSFHRSLLQGEPAYAEQLQAVIDRFKAEKRSFSSIEPHLIELIHAGSRAVQQLQLPLQAKEFQFHSLYQQLLDAETLDDVKPVFLRFFDAIVREVSVRKDRQQRDFNKITFKAIEYIELHYRQPISLQDIADELGVHHTYLSKVFKADTGENFSEYLNRYRIEKAKALIRTQKYRIKEIYGQVGFNQYTYFFRVFRQVTGITPAEYEKEMLMAKS